MDNNRIIRVAANKQERNCYKEVKDARGWINQGKNNRYPEYLLNLIENSSTHSAIIKTKSVLIGGGGWTETGISNEAISFLKNEFDTEDLSDILYKISLDLESLGYFALNIIWNENRDAIARISYINAATVRYAINDDDKYKNLPPIQHYFVSDDWSNIRANKPVFYQGFSAIYKEKDGDYLGNPSQILLVEEHKSKAINSYYTTPSWLSAEKWLLIESEVAEFHLNNIQNSFAPSMHLNMVGVPPQEEMDQSIKELKDQFKGTKNAGELLVTFSERESQNATEITPIVPNTNADQFELLINQTRDNIMVANQVVDPTLHGVLVAGSLGSADGNVLNSLAVFQAMYVNTKQSLIEKTFQELALVNGITDKLLIEKYTIELPKELDMNLILTIIQSPLSNKQKLPLLMKMGLDESEAQSMLPDETQPVLDTTKITENDK